MLLGMLITLMIQGSVFIDPSPLLHPAVYQKAFHDSCWINSSEFRTWEVYPEDLVAEHNGLELICEH